MSKKTKIMIDPGHGGSDPGAVANSLKEKNIVLTIAKEIRYLLLQNYEVEIKMTRENDGFIELSHRAKMANDWGADYFLSIHVNAGGGTGFESFIHQSQRQITKKLQQTMHSAIINSLNVHDRGQKSANYAVLRETKMPALLTECLFIDNENDAAKLKDSTFLKKTAQGHVNGLQQAFNLKRITETSNPNVIIDPTNGELYRVLINNQQIGAFSETENIVNQVKKHLGTAKEILLQKV